MTIHINHIIFHSYRISFIPTHPTNTFHGLYLKNWDSSIKYIICLANWKPSKTPSMPISLEQLFILNEYLSTTLYWFPLLIMKYICKVEECSFIKRSQNTIRILHAFTIPYAQDVKYQQSVCIYISFSFGVYNISSIIVYAHIVQQRLELIKTS